MRRTALSLIAFGLLVSACADDAAVATSPPAAATAATSEPNVTPSAPPLASPSDSPAASPKWAGPVRGPSGVSSAMDSDGGDEFRSTEETGDAAPPYVDIERVRVNSASQPHWRLGLADAPPNASTLDPPRTVISYGLTFETTGDDDPDYVVGISNEASRAGEYRVWVTDLATGETDEQDGPPYGFPVEFAHPDERMEDELAEPEMVFTFLPGSRPPGVSLRTRFYAWASLEEDGAVVAWDYAPDAGWIGAPPEADATEAAAPQPVPVGRPAEPAGFPECQADAFDFAGRGTLRGLGLHTATPVTPPDIDRAAMIWVTADLKPHDAGPEGGPVEMTRMLCFEFADGSGGSGWPVDPAWRPPQAVAAAPNKVGSVIPSPPILLLALVALLAVVGSALAFRRHH